MESGRRVTRLNKAVLLLCILLFAGLVFSITDITAPDPGKYGDTTTPTEKAITIAADGKEVGDGASITVSSKSPLEITIKNLKEKTNFLVSINEELNTEKTLPEIEAGKTKTETKPPFEYSLVKDGVLLKVESKASGTSKKFSINNWDGKEAITIRICQDKNGDNKCDVKKVENATVIISFKEIKCASILQCLAELDKKLVEGILKKK